MASRPQRRMTPAERAKQFMPFAAVVGLTEALERKEKEVEEARRTRTELTPEEAARHRFYDVWREDTPPEDAGE